ncbi:MAG: vWA domain-containing protein [Kofleriaceae bacterium]
MHFTATRTTPSIQLLVDRSTSMLEPITDATTMTKFAAVRAALVGPGGVVTQLQSKALFGASLYTHLDTPCPELRSVPRAFSNRTAIATLIDTTTPMGATPTGPAIDAAVGSFGTSPPTAETPRYIVLATDGLPNSCPGDPVNANTWAVQAAAAAHAAKIQLIVLAIDTNLPTSHLQELANAGAGQPGAPYYVATNPGALTTTLDTIIGGIVSCELTISGRVDPPQAGNGVVRLDGQPLLYGLEWTMAGPSTLRILGGACTALRTIPNASIDATFPCGTVIF